MKKIVISIPVHTAPQCVEDQINNIKKFVSNSSVVLHVSGMPRDPRLPFGEQMKVIASRHPGFVFLNPQQYNTHKENEAGQVTGLSTVHSSNFNYISSVMDFDTFALDTSNDFFVRKGIEDLFEKYACGFTPTRCPPDQFVHLPTMERIRAVIPLKTMEKGSQEGSFYPKEVFKEVAKKVGEISTFLDAEEAYLPSLAFNMFPELYDQCSNNHYVFHNPNHDAVTTEDILRIRSGSSPNQYSVKRVPREFQHPTRRYVNELTKND
jgi:hypothetical protein